MNSRSARRAAGWSLALALLTMMPMALAAAPACGLVIDGGMQAEIKAAVLGMTGSRSEEQRQTALEIASGLGDQPGVDRVHLLEQVAIFLAGAGGTEEAMGGAILLRLLHFQRDEILEATLPHMVAATPDLNKVLRELAATTVAPALDAGDPVTDILEIEAWRGTSAGVAPDPTRRAGIGGLLRDLSTNDNPWVRAYAATVVATDPEFAAAEEP